MKQARQTARGRKVSEAMKLYWKKRKRAEAALKRTAKGMSSANVQRAE